MYRATTPTHTFKLPFEYENYVSKILITYSQNDRIVLEKTEKDIKFNNNEISFTLTQEEANLFSCNEVVAVQVRVLTKNGTAMASKNHFIEVERVLNDEVLNET